MPVSVIFYHGWGFDSSIWTGIADLLNGWRVDFLDRGYFGGPRLPSPAGKCIAVTHSFGTLLALREPPPDCVRIVAINGFDRFVSKGNAPGVQPRVLARMIDRFESEPEATLRDFRQRCGSDAALPAINPGRLGEDLRLLASLDCEKESAAIGVPILTLQGSADPILPEAMRARVFGSADQIERRTIGGGGHLLPLTEPGACARAILEFCEVRS